MRCKKQPVHGLKSKGILLILSFVLLLIQINCVQGKPIISPETFTKKYSKILKEMNKDLHVVIVKPLELSIKNGTDEKTTFLNNAYDLYKQDPGNLNEILDRYVKSYVSGDFENKGVVREQIVPVIKDSAWLGEIEKTMKEKYGDTIVIPYTWEQYNSLLIIVYGNDTKNNIQYFTKSTFDSSGIPKDSLKEISIQNLKRILPKIERHGDSSVFMVTAGGDYEASLILIPSIWTKETFPVDGDIVVAIPSRDMLLVTGSKDKKGLKKIKEMAKDIVSKGGYYLTEQLFIYTDKGFDAFEE